MSCLLATGVRRTHGNRRVLRAFTTAHVDRGP
jgi:hypothetical protein